MMYAATYLPRADRPALIGPVHVVAGRTEIPAATSASGVHLPSETMTALFGDTVTACGLTLPRSAITEGTLPLWVSPTTGVRCGDCFRA